MNEFEIQIFLDIFSVWATIIVTKKSIISRQQKAKPQRLDRSEASLFRLAVFTAAV